MALTRKRFLRGAAALGVLPGIASIVAACGGGGGGEEAAPTSVPATTEAPPTTAAGTTEAAATETTAPAAGGILRASMGSDVRGFDVQRFYDPQSTMIGDVLFSRLVATDPQDAGTILPDLAEEVPTPEDGGLSYTFTLRDSTFHDGTPVTAADVKFSIERLISPKTKSEGGSYYIGLIKDTEALAAGEAAESTGITVIDDKTVRFELIEPRAAFLNLMALWFASIYPKAAVESKGDQFNVEPVGSGPFKLDSYEAGKKIVMSKFADYYAADQIALDGIEIDVAVNPDTAILRLDSGELDLMIDQVPPAAYSAIKNDPERSPRLVEGLVDNVWYITLNAVEDTPAFESVDARRAISMAINKDRLLQQLQNRGEVAVSYWSPESQYYDEAFPSIPYDPEQAKSLIASSGAAGQEVDLIVPAKGTYYPLDEFGPSLKQDLEQAGLKINLVSLEFSAWLNETMNAGAIVPNGWSMDNPHGSFVIDSAFTTATKEAADKDGTCCNFSRWASPEVDELNTTGNTTTDKQEEIQAYQEIMRIALGEQALWVPLIWPTVAYYGGEKLQGLFVPTNIGAVPLSKLSLTA
jgi:ABC-type transport system substrate-binding protein